jgi:hypothetical protein
MSIESELNIEKYIISEKNYICTGSCKHLTNIDKIELVKLPYNFSE